MSKQKDLGRSLEHRVAQRARAKGLEANRQPGSGQFSEFPADAVIANLLVECKVRSYATNAKGEDTIAFPIKALRKTQALALVNGFEQAILVVNPKGSHSPFVLMDFEWFLDVLADRERYRKALEQIVADDEADMKSYFLLQNIAALALDNIENPL